MTYNAAGNAPQGAGRCLFLTALPILAGFRFLGPKRWNLIFGMCDESFSINCSAEIPEGVDRGWFYFWVTLLNHAYWVTGAHAAGALCTGH